VDLFASQENRQLEKYFSWMHDPNACGIDALTQDWSTLNGFANPPFALIGRILNKVRLESATITLIAPIWVGAPWFPDLLDMSIEQPIMLPQWDRIFLPTGPHSQVPDNNPNWQAAAWRVSAKDSSNKDWVFRQPTW
jgi:hypothetical protein